MQISNRNLNFATMPLLKPVKNPDKRWKRPRTREARLLMIYATYALNNWGAQERAANAESVGLEPKPLNEYRDSELQAILDDLEHYKLILFED